MSSEAVKLLSELHKLKHGWNTEAPEDALQEAAKTEQFAKSQLAEGFPFLFAIGTVQTWSILEALVDDVLAQELSDPAVRAKCEPLKKLKGPLVEFADAPEVERIAILTERLKESVAAALRPGVGRFEEVLSLVGLGGPVPDDVRRTLLEISEVRHVLIHRVGTADGQFRSRCPWFEVKDRETVRVTHRHFQLYGFCARWYMMELSRRDSERRAVDNSPESRAYSKRFAKAQDEQLRVLERMWAARRGANRPDSSS